MGDSDEMEKAKEFATSSGALAEEAKFPTQVFWLTIKAMHVMLVPGMKEEFCFAMAVGHQRTGG